MDINLNVLLVSRSKDALDALESCLRKYAGLRLQRKIVVNGHVDPLHGVDQLPDALVLHLSHNWRAELESLAARPADRRPPFIVVGPADDVTLMRLAMQTGARDLLPVPIVEADLVAALVRIDRDRQIKTGGRTAAVTVFMNSKGGSGATLLACNVAHMLVAASQQRVALLDLDLQFGTAPLYLDLFPKRGLLQALENFNSLDQLALDGYLVRHASGLKVLGHAADDAPSTHRADARQIGSLLELMAQDRDHLIVDLPRRIDDIAVTAIERANNVVVVLQQSVTTLRDAARLTQILCRDFAVSRERLRLVVNRYDKNAPVTLEDIRRTLNCEELALVPNDFRTVSQCVNTGTPLFEYAPGAAITRALMTLETQLGGNSAASRPGLLARTFSGLLKTRSP